jgi:uncharacterized repeat protein (TIGR01451 family)
MQVQTRRWSVPVLVAGLLLWGLGTTAHAAGTLSDTQINNQATVSYDVLSVSQTPIESSRAGNDTPGSGSVTYFRVDNKVDLSVAEVSLGYTAVAGGGTNQVLVFEVTNEGNTVQDFLLTAVDQVGGADPFTGTDNFDPTNPFAPGEGIFVDNGDDTFVAVDDTMVFINELGPDLSVTVFVVRNIAALQADGDIAAIALNAQVAQGGTPSLVVPGAAIATDDNATADDWDTVEIVFADGIGDIDDQVNPDGQHSDTDAYEVGSAQVTIAKTSEVLSDPFTTSGNPKAIPGAIIEYTITISNDALASAAATSISITDSINAEVVALRLTHVADAYDTGAGDQGIEVTAPNINAGAPLALSNAVDADEGSVVANVVSVVGIELQPGESAEVKFQVELL